MPPIQGKPLLLYISTTKTTLGALLAQQAHDGEERVIYYISRTLVGYELNYTSIKRVCLDVIFCLQKLHHYMLTHKIKLVAIIDPLKYLLNRETLIGRLAKWVMMLSEFDIDYVDQKAINRQVIADQLANATMTDNSPLVSEFLDKSIFTVTKSRLWQL